MTEREGLTRTAEAIRRALLQNDTVALKNLYAEDYEGVDVRGEGDDLAMILQAYQPGAVVLETYQVEDTRVEVFSEIGIIRGTGHIRGRYQGHAFAHRVRFTDIFRKTDGKWRCWRSHLTEIVEK